MQKKDSLENFDGRTCRSKIGKVSVLKDVEKLLKV